MNPTETFLTSVVGKQPGWTTRQFFEELKVDLLRLGLMATACVGAALAFNQLREPPLPLLYTTKQARLEQMVARTDATTSPANSLLTVGASADSDSPAETPRIISLAELQSLVQAKKGMVLDARPEIFHRLGHMPGAISLSREGFEQDYAKQRTLLEPKRDQPLAVYCSSASCEDSQMVADALVKLGYRHVLVFKGGWEEWASAGLPEEHQ